MCGRFRSLFVLSLLAAACGSVRDPDEVGAVDAGVVDPDASTTAGPELEITGGPLDFFGVAVGQRSIAITLTVHNRGTTAVGPLTTTESGDAEEFELVDDCDGATVAPDDRCRIVVSFRPLVAGARAATLAIAAPGLDTPVTTTLAGRGLTGALTVTPSLHDFGAVDLAAQSAPASFQIDNTGQVVSGVVSLTVTGSSTFRLVDDMCSGTTIAVGGRCTFGVAYTPSTFGTAVGSVEIAGGVAGETAVSLTGRGQAVLNVARGGLGAGTITSTPAGIDCGPTCTARFEQSSVTLSAEPAANNVFMGWSGACSGASCSLTLATPMTDVTAVFEPLRTVTVHAGAGTVHVEPPNEDCITTSCAYSLPRTTPVRLVATPPEGYIFRRWYGSGCGAQSTCNFTVSNDTAVSAGFCAEEDICCIAPGSPACN